MGWRRGERPLGAISFGASIAIGRRWTRGERKAEEMRNEARSGGLHFGSNSKESMSRILVILAVTSVLVLLVAPAALAKTWIVSDPSDGTQATSLRYAIAHTNPGDTVQVSSSITLDPSLGPLEIQTGSIEIDGTGTGVTIDGDNGTTVFQVGASASNVTISGLTIQHGSGSCGSWGVAGGGIYCEGVNFTLRECTISHNTASGGSGGVAVGGGVFVELSLHPGSKVTIEECTFSDNSADNGGAIELGHADAVIRNCTFSGNSASNGGGGIDSSSSVAITNCTFTGNSAGGGGGIHALYGTVTVCDTILWANTGSFKPELYVLKTATVADCVVQGGYARGTNIITADPLLGTIGDYNSGLTGTTETIPLLPGSSAIDAGNSGTATTMDQRGVSRGGPPDIGAFESQGFTLSVPSGTPQTASINTAFAQPLVVDVASAHGEPVTGGAVTFDAPSSGASATVASNPVTIDSDGTISAIATANDVAGPYTVDAEARGATAGVSFSLANIASTISIEGNGHEIASGDMTPTTTDGSAFGSADLVTGTVDHTFTIANTDSIPVTLSGAPTVAITGTDAADFTVIVQPSSSLPTDKSATTFTIEFDPSAAGTRTATVSIANDSDTNPYTFAVSGTGSAGIGDVNGDSVINILDVRLCLEIAQGVIQGTAAQRAAADINRDGQVTLADAQLLAEYVAGIGTP